MTLETLILRNASAMVGGLLVGRGIRMIIDACKALRRTKNGLEAK